MFTAITVIPEADVFLYAHLFIRVLGIDVKHRPRFT